MVMRPEDFPRNDDGTFQSFAHPGGYPIFYLTQDGGILCPDCANQKKGSEASLDHEDWQWRIVTCGVHWEGAPLTCDHCNAEIESAYGEPEQENES